MPPLLVDGALCHAADVDGVHDVDAHSCGIGKAVRFADGNADHVGHLQYLSVMGEDPKKEVYDEGEYREKEHGADEVPEDPEFLGIGIFFHASLLYPRKVTNNSLYLFMSIY